MMRPLTLTLLALLAAPLAARADAPCGGITLESGLVSPARPLSTDPAWDDATQACVDAIAARLVQRDGLRTVTVMVKVSDAQRLDGTGEALRDALVERLVAAGLPAGRVAGVVAAGTAPGSVAVTFTERPATAQVATINAASGPVEAGPSRDALAPVGAGAAVVAEGWVRTGEDGTAALLLVDGSRIRLRPNTELHLGKLYLDQAMRRVVQLEVAKGGFDTEVSPGGDGSSFRVRTPYGTAGVRGTGFRMDVDDTHSRVETLHGAVGLEGSAAEVHVPALYGSRVSADGAPEAPRPLLAGPRTVDPLTGDLSGRGLRWAGVGKASGYVVEIARDAEFVIEVQRAVVDKAPRALAPTLGEGAWYWRVAAIDADGFVGAWSTVHGFHVAP